MEGLLCIMYQEVPLMMLLFWLIHLLVDFELVHNEFW